MAQVVVVVPCYNEARRLQGACFAHFAQVYEDVEFLFVDDGSRDGTWDLLKALTAGAGGMSAVRLPANRGKAEAVRIGMQLARRRAPAAIAFWDADLATPLDAIPAFFDVLCRKPAVDLVLGTRLPLQGHAIRRRWLRQLLGRCFSRCASQVLGISLVDTQCGAKMFRNTQHLEATLGEPFLSRWIFDVELLARLQSVTRRNAAAWLYELPLEQWVEIGGSKVCGRDFIRAAGELGRIGWTYRVRRWVPLPATAGFPQVEWADTASPVSSSKAA